MTPARPAGRPRRSSRATLEEAAAELFLENTYAATTVEQIAQRAGVSRATFFNYFASKADLLWAGLDDTLRAFGDALSSVGPAGAPVDGVVDALIGAACSRGVGWLPLALTQHEVMGLGSDVPGRAWHARRRSWIPSRRPRARVRPPCLGRPRADRRRRDRGRHRRGRRRVGRGRGGTGPSGGRRAPGAGSAPHGARRPPRLTARLEASGGMPRCPPRAF
ncbi:transcriptional regulator BetI [Clavibacter michiganensis subsp. michiganensis]|uniref:Transcriptional regulator BetI n=1 Tax=Clavibacter michiganensis subsp. michiganensis TaxID=33013 RepID=A0A251XE62_CLAMM|nr:transcriptional regulator BetI [Clavibacter michiganensis subsp. michiganensis]OUE00661.1 transcriptional regulator BetI [Clavibacter michiganensis subsp. michiganensis]